MKHGVTWAIKEQSTFSIWIGYSQTKEQCAHDFHKSKGRKMQVLIMPTAHGHVCLTFLISRWLNNETKGWSSM